MILGQRVSSTLSVVCLKIIASLVSSGSSDVSSYADEVGEPSYTKQRPLGAGFRPPPPGQEASPAALWNMGRQWVTANLMSHSFWSLRQTRPAGTVTPFCPSGRGLVIYSSEEGGEHHGPVLSHRLLNVHKEKHEHLVVFEPFVVLTSV